MRDTRLILILLFLFIIIIAIILIRIIIKHKTGDNYKIGYSYLPKHITKLEVKPIIDIQTENIEKCMTKCKHSPSCNGITFDSENYKCLGYESGMMAKTDPNLYAWEKPSHKKTKATKTIIGENHSNQDIIKSYKMTIPYEVSNFMFAFWINITDWYSQNHGYWKCVFFKGHTINLNTGSKSINKTNNWEDIIQQLPEQCIGVWLAPYTNNLRICISSHLLEKQKMSPSHNYLSNIDNFSNVSDKKEETYNFNVIKTKTTYMKNMKNMNSTTNIMEYFDILDIEIAKPNFIAVNIHQSIMEIYLNDKLNHIVNLEGIPQFNEGDLNIKNSPSFNGNLQNISYLPYSATYKEIKDLYNNYNYNYDNSK